MSVRSIRLLAVIPWLAACGSEVISAEPLAVAEQESGWNTCLSILSDIINGRSYNPGDIDPLGPSDPAEIFNNGGSENHAVACRAAMYHHAHDPAWMRRYFDIQLQSGHPRFLGGEAFSAVYTHIVVGAAVATLKHARDRGHNPLVASASEWLRTVWAYQALTAINKRLTSQRAYNMHGTLQYPINQPGYNTAIVGDRTYVNGYNGSSSSVTGNGGHPILLTIALEHPARHISARLDNWWLGIRVAVEAVGYRLDANGRVNLRSKSIAAKHFGLSKRERKALRRFITSKGFESLDAVFGMLAFAQRVCPFTVIRTTGGVISWYGTSAEPGHPCNGRKGGSWAAATIDYSGTATFLTRSNHKWGYDSRQATVWRDGNQICAESPLPRKCLPIPGGDLVYEVIATRRGGLVCVDGSCASPPVITGITYGDGTTGPKTQDLAVDPPRVFVLVYGEELPVSGAGVSLFGIPSTPKVVGASTPERLKIKVPLADVADGTYHFGVDIRGARTARLTLTVVNSGGTQAGPISESATSGNGTQ